MDLNACLFPSLVIKSKIVYIPSSFTFAIKWFPKIFLNIRWSWFDIPKLPTF